MAGMSSSSGVTFFTCLVFFRGVQDPGWERESHDRTKVELVATL